MTIEGVIVRDLSPFTDQRGWLMELFRRDENKVPAMSYISSTYPGVTRGPHEHKYQSDSFCFFSSEFTLGLWDNRPNSPTYKTEMIVVAGEVSPKSVWVPPGVVHAYRNTGSTIGLVVNFPDRLYKGEGRSEPIDEIRHEDDPNTLFTIPAFKSPSKRYYMEGAIVTAEQINDSTWRVNNAFNSVILVDNQCFEKKFTEI